MHAIPCAFPAEIGRACADKAFFDANDLHRSQDGCGECGRRGRGQELGVAQVLLREDFIANEANARIQQMHEESERVGDPWNGLDRRDEDVRVEQESRKRCGHRALRVYRRAADGYFDGASASISASIFATRGAKSIPRSSSWIRRASSCGSSRWSHRLPSFPSIRRNLVPGAMPCASRVSFGITILPARSTGTTVVINGLDTISDVSRDRRHGLPGFPVPGISSRRPLRGDTERTSPLLFLAVGATPSRRYM